MWRCNGVNHPVVRSLFALSAGAMKGRSMRKRGPSSTGLDLNESVRVRYQDQDAQLVLPLLNPLLLNVGCIFALMPLLLLACVLSNAVR